MFGDWFKKKNSVNDSHARYTDDVPTHKRIHPLALWSFVLALLGIPLLGLITGTIAVLLAGIALGQMAENPFFRGRRMAFAGMSIGLADIVLWVILLGLIIPRSDSAVYRSVEQFTFPSPNILERAPSRIRKALESNVFLVVDRKGWPAFINSETLSGSGVILGQNDGQYLILTNRHVVDPLFSSEQPAREDPRNFITVYFHNGSHRKAYICWTAAKRIGFGSRGYRCESLGNFHT